MFGNTGPFSYAPRGFSQDDFGAPSPQRRSMSRPSGKSIYMQRKEYSEVLNREPEKFHVRVEHLFTCELDGQDVRTVENCVAKLKRLDAKGRVWPQEMILEVHGGSLLLTDIETKVELESMPLSCIQKTKAVLDSCAYNSLLMVTVKERSKSFPQVYMFQCEETGAEILKRDLDKITRKQGGDVDPHGNQSDIRSDLENIMGQHAVRSFRQAGPLPVQPERSPPPQEYPVPQWGNREQDNMPLPLPPPPRAFNPPEETFHPPDLLESHMGPLVPPMPEQTDAERNTDIFNHVLNDLEIFMGKLSSALNAPQPQEGKSKKKKGKKTKKNAVINLPPWEEYVSCLQKIKYGFNLLGQLDRTLSNPSAPDFVHIFFANLQMMIPQYPADLPPTVLNPLLTEAALRLLSQVVGPEEDQLWRSLGDCWNIPRSRWPDENVPPYVPVFYDGWQPLAPAHKPSSLPYQNDPMSSQQRFPPEIQDQLPREMQLPPEEPFNSPWGSAPPPREPLMYMRVIYDFMARNNKELSVMKGEVVEVVQRSKQWWLVRNARGEDGNVPQNVLEPVVQGGMHAEDMQQQQRQQPRGAVTLSMSSMPAEVGAWLDYKGFSKITVRSLGVLTGQQLLQMSKDQMRTVSPEEGGKVFFQLQAIKSAIALASEPSGMYNGRY